MAKEITDAKLCVLTCPFEPPKPKTKHKLELETVQAYEEMQAAEKQYFVDMIEKVGRRLRAHTAPSPPSRVCTLRTLNMPR